VVLVCSPPLTIGLSAWLIGLAHRAPFVYIVQELYPDIAVRLGVLRNRSLLRVLYALERFVYRRAARVTAIAPGMRRRLLEKGVPGEKAILIPNFVDTSRLAPLPKDNPFARERGLVDSFVVSYAGNMGLAQGLETLLDAARLLREEPGIRFLILGEGVLRDALQQRVRDEVLNNVLFLPHQPFERMAEVYGTSDLNLVPLAAEAGGDALPSKVYRILACARPILALADEGSDLAAFVRETGCGLVVPPARPRELAEALRAVARDGGALAERVRERYAAVVAAYTRPEVTGRYRRLLEGLAAENRLGQVAEGSR
jgi:colanic acid biosynthesis glycosyl transferase WcaI